MYTIVTSEINSIDNNGKAKFTINNVIKTYTFLYQQLKPKNKIQTIIYTTQNKDIVVIYAFKID